MFSLSAKGFAHTIIPVLVIVMIAILGTGYVVYSHADPLTSKNTGGYDIQPESEPPCTPQTIKICHQQLFEFLWPYQFDVYKTVNGNKDIVFHGQGVGPKDKKFLIPAGTYEVSFNAGSQMQTQPVSATGALTTPKTGYIPVNFIFDLPVKYKGTFIDYNGCKYSLLSPTPISCKS